MENKVEPLSGTKFPPSIVIVFIFLYVLAKYKKLSIPPVSRRMIRQAQFLKDSEYEKHLVVELNSEYLVSLFADKSEIAFCFWNSMGMLMINESVHCNVLLSKEKVRPKKEEIRHEQYYNVPFEHSPFCFSSIKSDINTIRRSASAFLTYDLCEAHFLLNEKSLEGILHKFPNSKDSCVDMFNYFHVNLLNYLQEKFIFQS